MNLIWRGHVCGGTSRLKSVWKEQHLQNFSRSGNEKLWLNFDTLHYVLEIPGQGSIPSLGQSNQSLLLLLASTLFVPGKPLMIWFSHTSWNGRKYPNRSWKLYSGHAWKRDLFIIWELMSLLRKESWWPACMGVLLTILRFLKLKASQLPLVRRRGHSNGVQVLFWCRGWLVAELPTSHCFPRAP